MFVSSPVLALCFAALKQCCDEKVVTEGGGIQTSDRTHQQPSLVHAGQTHNRKATSFCCFTKKSLFSLGILLIIRIFLKLFSCNEFVLIHLKTNKQRKEKEGSQPASQASLWFSLRIHPNFPSTQMSPIGHSHCKGASASE